MRIAKSVIVLFTFLGVTASYGQQQTADPSISRPSVAPPAKDRFHIYLLMGQSNMVGRDTHKLDGQPEDSRILDLTGDGRWVVAHDPLHEDTHLKPGVGPGLSFAREIVKANPTITVGLVPCAVGGTPLKRWVKGADLYEKAVSRARLAKEAGVLKGVLWHQGEAETNNKDSAESYQARLAQMFKDLRADLGQPDLPIVVGQLGEFLSNSPEKYPFLDTVRDAIKQMPTAAPHVGYADSAGLTDKGDKLHFNADSQREFGVRYAKAMALLRKP